MCDLLILIGLYSFPDLTKEDPEIIQQALYTIIAEDYDLNDDSWPLISHPAKDFVRSMIQVNSINKKRQNFDF